MAGTGFTIFPMVNSTLSIYWAEGIALLTVTVLPELAQENPATVTLFIEIATHVGDDKV